MGRAVFGPGPGLTPLNKATAQLDSRADQLFKPSASPPAINAALAKFKGLSQQVKELSKSASAVVKLDDELQQAEKDLKLAQEAKVLDSTGKADLESIDDSKTKWAKEKDLRAAEARSNDVSRVVLKTTKGDIVV